MEANVTYKINLTKWEISLNSKLLNVNAVTSKEIMNWIVMN